MLILSNARPKYNVNKVPMWVFRYVGNKLLISPVKIRIFCPKLALLFILGWLIWCPVDGLAGGCGARAVSCKTPIYFIITHPLDGLDGMQNIFV